MGLTGALLSVIYVALSLFTGTVRNFHGAETLIVVGPPVALLGLMLIGADGRR